MVLAWDRSSYVRDEPPRHTELPLQRGQIRSPTHALSKVPRQLRQMRCLRSGSAWSVLRIFAMPFHMVWATQGG